MYNNVFIVLPSYKPDRELLLPTVKGLVNSFRYVVVIDDGGGSEYAKVFEEVKDLGAIVLTHYINSGKGRALKTALNYIFSNYKNVEAIVTADGDGQHTLEDIEKIAKKTVENPNAYVLGARNFSEEKIPLRSRFGISEKLNFYDIDECVQIVKRTAKVFNTTIEDAAALEIAKRSRGTPRIANRLFRRVRDFANYAGKDHVTVNEALQALRALKVDELGLDDVDIRYLRTVIERFKGGPVGLDTLASAIGEEIDNLEDVYEPYLLQIGMIDRTARGRVATDKAYKHLNIMHQGKLF